MTDNTSSPMIRTRNLHRIFKDGNTEVHAVNDVSLDIQTGKMTAIIGRSGAGKTTLLNLISGLDTPTEGDVWINKVNLFKLSETDRLRMRRQHIGFIFQNFGLLPLLSAAENVGVPLRMRGVPRETRIGRVEKALKWVGLEQRKRHRPYELSGGEQQRVAVARALASQPRIILADEPTGQLDTQTGRQVLDIMRTLTERLGITLVIVTHDEDVIRTADVVHELRDGVLLPAPELTSYHHGTAK
jgi:putative ABC transport system ATP-binding protein